MVVYGLGSSPILSLAYSLLKLEGGNGMNEKWDACKEMKERESMQIEKPFTMVPSKADSMPGTPRWYIYF